MWENFFCSWQGELLQRRDERHLETGRSLLQSCAILWAGGKVLLWCLKGFVNSIALILGNIITSAINICTYTTVLPKCQRPDSFYRTVEVQESDCPWNESSRLPAPSCATSKPQEAKSKLTKTSLICKALVHLFLEVFFSSWEPLSCYLPCDSLAHVMLPVSQALLLHRLFCHLICHSFQLPAWSEELEGEFGIQW